MTPCLGHSCEQGGSPGNVVVQDDKFIFAAYKDEDEAGNMISFPKDIDIQKLLEKMPATTESALSPGKIYRDYTFDELRRIMSG